MQRGCDPDCYLNLALRSLIELRGVDLIRRQGLSLAEKQGLANGQG
jgi:hypothetical protein